MREHAALSRLRTLVDQLRSPLLLLLIFAAGASAATGEWADASIVLAVVAGTVGLGASREYSARAAARVARWDPQTLKVEDVVRYPSDDVFFGATAALQVGKEIWIGSVRGDRIARYPAR